MLSGTLESGFEGYLRSTRRLTDAARVISSAGITTPYDAEEPKRPDFVVERRVDLDDGIIAMKQAKIEASANLDVVKVDQERFSDFVDLLTHDAAFYTNVTSGSPR